jgi:hypothetical protein
LATRISKRSPHDGADLLGKLVRALRRSEIGGDGLGAAAGFADVPDDRFRLLRAAPVMDEHLRAGPGERQRTGPADTARGAGDESRLSRKSGHGLGSLRTDC